jgi:hypothetical protein
MSQKTTNRPASLSCNAGMRAHAAAHHERFSCPTAQREWVRWQSPDFRDLHNIFNQMAREMTCEMASFGKNASEFTYVTNPTRFPAFRCMILGSFGKGEEVSDATLSVSSSHGAGVSDQ